MSLQIKHTLGKAYMMYFLICAYRTLTMYNRHIITPYKELIARQPTYSAFNHALSFPRVKIQHSFGIFERTMALTLRYPNTYKRRFLSQPGHQKVMEWTMACLVLHNMLAKVQDDESWLQEMIEQHSYAKRGPG